MNIDNLKRYIYVGQIIKSYKECCKLIDEEVKGGKSKQLQLKNWSRYFKYHKNGNKFVIDKVYTTPLSKVDNRKGHSGKSPNSRNNNNIYGKYIDPILLDYFSDIDRKSILYETTNTIAKIVGLINKNYGYAFSNKENFYSYCKRDIKHKFSNIGFNKYTAWDFFGIVKGRLKDTIRYSLNRLQKKGYIDYKEVYILSYQYEKRPATSIEEVLIKDIDKQICKELNIEKKNKLQYNDRLRDKYYNLLDKRVKENIVDVDMMYCGYQIQIYKDKILNKESKTDIERLQQELNNLFINRVIDKLQNIHEQNLQCPKIWGTINSCTNIETKAIYHRQQESYINFSRYICSILLDIKQELVYIRN